MLFFPHSAWELTVIWIHDTTPSDHNQIKPRMNYHVLFHVLFFLLAAFPCKKKYMTLNPCF